MTPIEVNNLLENKPTDIINIGARRHGMLCFFDGGRSSILTDIIFNPHHFTTKANGANQRYTGRCACKGFSVGQVRKIVRYSNSIDFNKGDIILCKEGDPDLIPLIKLAGGIISEQGGVTCHVAIIAREFNIPCLMGVGSVSDDFADGELIILDATEEIFYRSDNI